MGIDFYVWFNSKDKNMNENLKDKFTLLRNNELMHEYFDNDFGDSKEITKEYIATILKDNVNKFNDYDSETAEVIMICGYFLKENYFPFYVHYST